MKKHRSILLSILFTLMTVFSATSWSAPTVFGEITEVIAAAGYTYIEINSGNGKVWAAGPETALKVGDRTGFETDMPMANFHSKSMNRDFDVIYFVDKFLTEDGKTAKVEVKDLSAEPAATSTAKPKFTMPPGIGAGGLDNLLHNQSSMPAKSKPELPPLKDFGKVDGGNTIAEIYADRKALAGKTVRVRGQVTKYTANVMGNNWLHIADSSGKDDLTVITQAQSAMDDIVVIEGRLELDQDFEFGYFYPLIVKDAKVTKE
jgi:hypothetical protein